MTQQIQISKLNIWYDLNKEFLSKYLVIILVALTQGISALSDISLSFLYKDDFKMSPA